MFVGTAPMLVFGKVDETSEDIIDVDELDTYACIFPDYFKLITLYTLLIYICIYIFGL